MQGIFSLTNRPLFGEPEIKDTAERHSDVKRNTINLYRISSRGYAIMCVTGGHIGLDEGVLFL